MPIELKFLRIRYGITWFILQSLNHSGGETSHKTWTSMTKRFGKSKKLSSQEESKELHNIECGGQAAQSLKIHGSCLTTWTIVVRWCKRSCRSSPGDYKMRKMFKHCQISKYLFMLIWYLFPPPIVVFSL